MDVDTNNDLCCVVSFLRCLFCRLMSTLLSKPDHDGASSLPDASIMAMILLIPFSNEKYRQAHSSLAHMHDQPKMSKRVENPKYKDLSDDDNNKSVKISTLMSLTSPNQMMM